MSVRVSVESARGCGYRKEGGLYLVSGELSEPCPLLPFETSVCPTCGEGIKPARGFTWVDGQKFIPPDLHGSIEHSVVCPLAPVGEWKEHPDTGRPMWVLLLADGTAISRRHAGVRGDDYSTFRDQFQSRLGRCGLIWIGEQHYKTAHEFMVEAARMGVSRRITAVPRDFKVGETWVLLGHRKAIEKACSECGDEGVPDADCPVCQGTGYEHRPGVITAFRPTAIEYVVKPEEEDDEEFLEGLEKRGITPVKVVKDTDQQTLGV